MSVYQHTAAILDVEEFNDRYAVIIIGGRLVILDDGLAVV